MSMYKKIAIIIVSLNGEKFLPDCLDSVILSEYPRECLNLILVDNNSQDRSVSILEGFQKRHPSHSIKIIKNKKNLGFCGGYNVGIKEGLKEDPSFFVLLNQDTVIDKLCIKELASVADEKEDIAMVQARLMLWGKKNIINSLGNEFHFLGFGYTRGYKQVYDGKDYHKSFDSIPYSSGCAFLIKRKVLERIGLLDEDIFAYHEDTDWSLHSRILGYDVVVAYHAIVWHKYEFSRSIQKYYFMERNRILLLLWYYKVATLIFVFPAWLFMEVGLLFFSFINGWWKEKFRAYWYFFSLKNWKKILKKRRIIQKQRIKKDKDICKLFTARIEFQDVDNVILIKIVNPLLSLYWRLVKPMIRW